MRWHAVMASTFPSCEPGMERNMHTCWRYFPEVNYNHLTSVLKRLELETHMPLGSRPPCCSLLGLYGPFEKLVECLAWVGC